MSLKFCWMLSPLSKPWVCAPVTAALRTKLRDKCAFTRPKKEPKSHRDTLKGWNRLNDVLSVSRGYRPCFGQRRLDPVCPAVVTRSAALFVPPLLAARCCAASRSHTKSLVKLAIVRHRETETRSTPLSN